MKRLLALILFTLLVLSAGLILFLNSVYLPAKIRSIITASLAPQLNTQITFKDFNYSFFKGIVIKDLAIFPANSTADKPLISAEEVYFQVLYLPIFRSKSIIIPSLKIDAATINITRFPDGNWNWRALNLKPAAKPEFLFLVYRANLTGAKVFFEDYGAAEPFLTEVPQLKAKANLALPKNVKFILEAKLAKETASGVLLVNGNYDLGENRLSAKMDLHNFNPLVFSPYLDFPFALNRAAVKEAQAEMLFDRGGLRLNTRLACEGIDISRDPLHLNADASIDLKIDNQTFNAETEVFNAALTGIPRLEEISGVKGKLLINPQGVRVEELSGVSRETVISATGKIFNFASPQIEAKVFASPTVEKLIEIFSDVLSRYEFAAKGETQLVLNLSGALSQPVFVTDLQLTNAKLDTPQLKFPLTEINGKVQITQDSATWEKLSFVFDKNTFVATGTLEDLANPALELALGSKMLSLSTKVDIFKDSLNFSRLDGKYLNSVFALTGKVDLNEPDNPWLDLAGKLTLNLKDLKELESFEPTGMFNIQGTLRGFLKNRRLW
ncbi:MAG: AsmA family protein, partial [Candidatus Omnitrophota bacterium]